MASRHRVRKNSHLRHHHTKKNHTLKSNKPPPNNCILIVDTIKLLSTDVHQGTRSNTLATNCSNFFSQVGKTQKIIYHGNVAAQKDGNGRILDLTRRNDEPAKRIITKRSTSYAWAVVVRHRSNAPTIWSRSSEECQFTETKNRNVRDLDRGCHGPCRR